MVSFAADLRSPRCWTRRYRRRCCRYHQHRRRWLLHPVESFCTQQLVVPGRKLEQEQLVVYTYHAGRIAGEVAVCYSKVSSIENGSSILFCRRIYVQEVPCSGARTCKDRGNSLVSEWLSAFDSDSHRWMSRSSASWRRAQVARHNSR